MKPEIDLVPIFKDTVERPWITVGRQDTQLCIERITDTSLRITFQWTDPTSKNEAIYIGDTMIARDILTDINFIAKPYKRMKKLWFAHRGFLKAYKSVNDYILTACQGIKQVEVRGYSLGGALATLCYEDIQFNFPDIDLSGFIFGSPRVFWFPPKWLKQKFYGLWSIRNYRDLLSRAPFAWCGFCHVGNQMILGEKGTFTIEQHSYDNYIRILTEAK